MKKTLWMLALAGVFLAGVAGAEETIRNQPGGVFGEFLVAAHGGMLTGETRSGARASARLAAIGFLRAARPRVAMTGRAGVDAFGHVPAAEGRGILVVHMARLGIAARATLLAVLAARAAGATRPAHAAGTARLLALHQVPGASGSGAVPAKIRWLTVRGSPDQSAMFSA